MPILFSTRMILWRRIWEEKTLTEISGEKGQLCQPKWTSYRGSKKPHNQSSRGKVPEHLTSCHRLFDTGRLPGAWNRRFWGFLFFKGLFLINGTEDAWAKSHLSGEKQSLHFFVNFNPNILTFIRNSLLRSHFYQVWSWPLQRTERYFPFPLC